MRVVVAACGLGLLALPLFSNPTRLTLPAVPEPLATADPECSGCSAEPVDTAELTAAAFDRLVARFAGEPMCETSLALETLLFHGARTRELIAVRGTATLDARRRAFLDRELRRDQVAVSFRIVDADGVERARLAPTVVALGHKTHLHSGETVALQPHEYAGRVERVGLRHLWTRF